MEHPLINNLSELSEDELTSKISELNGKLNIAMRSGNSNLCNQIRMALESYQNKYQEKINASYKKQLENSSLSKKIDIK